MLSKTVYWPFTPAGSALAHLESITEAAAWKKLLKDAAHMPCKTIANFKKRGYTVEKVESYLEHKSKGGTRIDFIARDSSEFAIWLDTDIGVEDGLCLAISSDPKKARKIAIKELKSALKFLEEDCKDAN